MSPRRPSLGDRIGASLRGAVPADEVLARLSASGGVYDDYLAADRLRDELVLADIGPTANSPTESSQLLCTWIAYAAVSLAQAFVTAEGIDPAQGGFLPPVSAEQALLLLGDVPAWSARARRAAQEPGYDVAAEVCLPAPLPWVVVEPCPRSHLDAMRQAGGVMLERIEAALGDMGRLSSTAAPVLSQLRGMAVDAQSRLQYAAALASAAGSGPVHEGVEKALRDGVTACWLLGQVLARPRLLGVLPPPPSAAPPGYPTRQPGYDAAGTRPYGGWTGGGFGHGDHHGHHGHHDDD